MDAAEVGGARWLDVAATLAEIERLQTQRDHREVTRLHYVEGARNLLRAAARGIELAALVCSEPLLKVPQARRLLREQARAGVPCLRLSPDEMRRVTRLQRATGVGAVLRQHWSPLHRTPAGAGLCWLALERVRSPGNLGTLIRTAEAVGAAGLLLLGRDIDPFDPHVVRASMGALFGLRLVRTGPGQLRHWIRRHHCRVIAASPQADRDFHRVFYRRPLVVMLGEERRGLSAIQRSLSHELVRIPMADGCDSLNIGVAGSLLLYEAWRRVERLAPPARPHAR
jgi:TrmH family RNA methyltransferase